MSDNPALTAASETGRLVLPIYIAAFEEEKPWSPGAASLWWLHGSLKALQISLKERDLRLILRRGKAFTTLRQIAKEAGSSTVYWNRRYESHVHATRLWKNN